MKLSLSLLQINKVLIRHPVWSLTKFIIVWKLHCDCFKIKRLCNDMFHFRLIMRNELFVCLVQVSYWKVRPWIHGCEHTEHPNGIFNNTVIIQSALTQPMCSKDEPQKNKDLLLLLNINFQRLHLRDRTLADKTRPFRFMEFNTVERKMLEMYNLCLIHWAGVLPSFGYQLMKMCRMQERTTVNKEKKNVQPVGNRAQLLHVHTSDVNTQWLWLFFFFFCQF